MYSYIKGTITEIENGYITIENNDIGYLVYVANSYSYKTNDKVTIYLYQQIKEDEHILYGFKTKEEKELFLKLIGVKGLGCKMAILMLDGDINSIYNAIETSNISYLKKFPKIGDKVARQIILDLKGKLEVKEDIKGNYDELCETLKSLGYKQADIKKILPNIDSTLPIEKQVKEALKYLLK